MPSVERLALDGNRLTTLPEFSAASLATLKSVSLNENQLGSIPASFGRLQFVEDVDLSYCPKSAPAETGTNCSTWHP